jgi:hypothetical protein
LTNEIVLNKAKAEFKLFGQRQALVDVKSLCDHLDSLVGPVVGEVIMSNLETRLGKEDGARLRTANPSATIEELVAKLEETDLITGMGITKVTLSKDPGTQIKVEISNPIVRANSGAAKSFLFSWWCGVLTSLLGRELDIKTVDYDEKANVLRCEIGSRTTQT